MQQVPIDQIGYDPKYYPRSNGKEDWLTVHRYRDALEADKRRANPESFPKIAFPPLIVVRATGKKYKYMLIDGLHRLKALVAAGFTHVYVIVERLPESKWLARSAELNIRGARPMDKGDKAWVAARLTADGYDDAKIAEILCMRVESLEKIVLTSTHKLTVRSAKDLPEGRANRLVNGKHVGFLKGPFQDAVGTANAATALKVQGPLSARDNGMILDAAIAVLESGTLDTHDEEIIGRLQSLDRLVADVLQTTVV